MSLQNETNITGPRGLSEGKPRIIRSGVGVGGGLQTGLNCDPEKISIPSFSPLDLERFLVS